MEPHNVRHWHIAADGSAVTGSQHPSCDQPSKPPKVSGVAHDSGRQFDLEPEPYRSLSGLGEEPRQ
jgi:hypothetical protein